MERMSGRYTRSIIINVLMDWIRTLFAKIRVLWGSHEQLGLPTGYFTRYCVSHENPNNNIYAFESISGERINNGILFKVKNPIDSDDFDWLNGKHVFVDEKSYMVLQVISDKPRDHKSGEEIYIRVAKVKRKWS